MRLYNNNEVFLNEDIIRSKDLFEFDFERPDCNLVNGTFCKFCGVDTKENGVYMKTKKVFKYDTEEEFYKNTNNFSFTDKKQYTRLYCLKCDSYVYSIE